MKQRCTRESAINFKWYGGKGIGICQEWLNDYQAFKTWAMSAGYDETKSRKEQSLDRIDNLKGYEPDNCRFVSHSTNCKNTSRNRFITLNGETKCINDWSKTLGIPVETIRSRMDSTDNPSVILDTIPRSHMSNTGIKGITKNKHGRYVVYVNRHYMGTRKSLEEAIALQRKVQNEPEQ